MDRVTRFAAVNSKITTMEGEFLKEADYVELLQKRSVTEVARYLKEKTAYRGVLEQVDAESIHRGQLENLIKQNMIRNIDKIIHYFNGNYRRFVSTLYAKYEIEELKQIARAVYNGRDANDFRSSAFIGKYSGIDAERIFEAKITRDMIYALEGSEFYEFLVPLINDDIRENLFRFEMVLDMAYYSLLQRAWSKLDKSDIRLLKQAQGLMADLLNLQWIYRGIKFYRLSPGELLNYTIDIGYRLKGEFIKKLCYAGSPEEVFRLTRETRYSFMFKNDETTDLFMERRMERHIFFELKAMERSHNLSIITTFAYILFLEFEVRDIIAVIESIRYRVPLDEAYKYIIREL